MGMAWRKKCRGFARGFSIKVNKMMMMMMMMRRRRRRRRSDLVELKQKSVTSLKSQGSV